MEREVSKRSNGNCEICGAELLPFIPLRLKMRKMLMEMYTFVLPVTIN